MENKRAILLLSGGIDSTTLLAKLVNEGYDIFALSFDYGQKHNIELEFAKRNAQKYKVIKHIILPIDPKQFEKSALVNNEKGISQYPNTALPQGQVNVYVPFRNLVFLSTALSYAETECIKEIFVAFNHDDGVNFWDCSPTFLENINRISVQGNCILIIAPFIEMQKKEVVILAKRLGVEINETISCYQPIEQQECGICLSCVIKRNAVSFSNSSDIEN
jgi:7-cyano-7-deazaguanine synthase